MAVKRNLTLLDSIICLINQIMFFSFLRRRLFSLTHTNTHRERKNKETHTHTIEKQREREREREKWGCSATTALWFLT